ncbi:nitrate- and nitrite sensing domain-containing protein [Streptomyces justiciae]|uniref:nitrate- and nitrite sensing domain-containing protein n=1 Tax=Streptomyces justiciae TaxID=2780140 RepID=UPI0021189B3A|nr:nitrate- and nitrite sensing domain-containing protein [Streptomyces justiciae]MCW8384648.1 nitrate- and nitrite sensing domain-containing protein [Streptomyces justiciae]
MVLLVLALVPIMALVGQWTWNSVQLYGDWRTQKDRADASNRAGPTVAIAFFALQEERRLSAAALADPAAYRKQLRAQRVRTDAAVKSVDALPDHGWKAPDDIRGVVAELDKELRKLPGYRAGVDGRNASQRQTFDHYTVLVSQHLKVFDTLANVGVPDINRYVTPAMDGYSALEMISREDAYFTRASVTGHLSGADRGQLAGWMGVQHFIYDSKVVPLLPDDEAERYRRLMGGSAWKAKSSVEQGVLGDPAGGTFTDRFPAELADDWRDSGQQVITKLRDLDTAYGKRLTALTGEEVDAMQRRLLISSVSNAVAVILVVLITMWSIRMLRRRISALRTAALDLQTRLPDVVDRMRQGETVDVDAELPEIRHGGDELGQLGQALNLARHTALETTVTQVGQFRGFERLLQRIARRTQLLIGLQMKKLTELERRHDDPEVLEGLFDLDHLTARLRRYEENLVILGGGQPQRRWRKPVLLLDVLRSAQSEVQNYRRIHIEVESHVWLSERAVGLVIHMLAELMENAVGFSRPPTPVEVYAARVGRGLAVEIEDRGVGMDAEQYEEINRMMAEPPRVDAMSRAEDVRLGLYVVSRLAQGLDIQVELRPSAFGGTRAVVLIPDELVVADDPGQPGAAPEAAVSSWPPPDPVSSGPYEAAPTSRRPHPTEALADPVSEAVGAHHPPAEPETVALRMAPMRPAPTGAQPRSASTGTVKPLPRRVRQASLVDELRSPDAAARGRTDDVRAWTPRPTPSRSGATIGAFQRQSRMARRSSLTTGHDQGSDGTPPSGTRFPTEDGPR